jgi:hypothetical protein
MKQTAMTQYKVWFGHDPDQGSHQGPFIVTAETPAEAERRARAVNGGEWYQFYRVERHIELEHTEAAR